MIRPVPIQSAPDVRTRTCVARRFATAVAWQVMLGVGIVIGSLPAARLNAQSSGRDADSLDLARALVTARAHAPAFRAVAARRDMVIGRATEAAQWLNPTIEYRRENLGSRLSPDIFATLAVPLDLSGRKLALRRARSAATDRASADGAAERRDAELEVARAWLRASSAQAQLNIIRTHADELLDVARVDSVRQREGLIAEGVALRTKLEADRARVQVATAAGEWARARAELARALGVPTAELPPVHSVAAPTLPPSPDSTLAIRLAMQSRPEVAARNAAVREATARLRAESRAAIGDWQLLGGSKQTAGVLTGQVGLALPLPLFNRNEGARQRARGELAEAVAWRDDTAARAQADVIASIGAYSAMRDHAAEAATFASRGREVASIARTAYREGHATLLELLDAQRAASDALLAHLRFTVDAWLTRLDLERALGARLDDSSPLDLPLRSTLLPDSPR